MDCKHADALIMQYGEGSLSHSDAKNLTKHLLVCEDCRESFLIFDICLDETRLIEAPSDFTQNVMARVRELGAKRFMHVRVFVGLAAVFIGALLFVYQSFGYTGDFFGNLSELVQHYGVAARPFFENIGASLSFSAQFSQFTFLFVPLLFVLLFVLHSTEKKVEA